MESTKPSTPSNYRLPVRTWEALDRSVSDLSTRLARVEGRVSVLLMLLSVVTTTNVGILVVALRILTAGG